MALATGHNKLSSLGWQGSQGKDCSSVIVRGPQVIGAFDPCNNPADAWPIIVKYGIGIIPFKNGLSESWDLGNGLINGTVKDKNPLRAAMIVFLMMKEAGNV
ncbi:hypothetical protein D3C80_1149960 [compost metagenome]